MDIAAMSTILSQAKIQQQASISVMKMAMDNGQQTNQLLKDMLKVNKNITKQSLDPNLGRVLDIRI